MKMLKQIRMQYQLSYYYSIIYPYMYAHVHYTCTIDCKNKIIMIVASHSVFWLWSELTAVAWT